MSKTGIFIVIIVAVIVGAVLYSNSQPVPSGVIVPAVNTQRTAPVQKVLDTSNASLNSDTTAIDTQMKSLDADTTNISESINDQPIDPTL